MQSQLHRRVGAAACAAGALLAGALLCGCEQAQPLSMPGLTAHELSLAVIDSRIAAAWHGGAANRNALWLRLTDLSGEPAGAPLLLTDEARDAYEADVQGMGGEVVLAWYEKNRQDGSLTAMLARFDLQGKRRWQHELSAPGNDGRNPVVRVSGKEIAVAWIESAPGIEPAIWSARLDADGKFIDAPVRRADAGRDTWNLNAAADESGTFYVVYDSRVRSRAKELHLLEIGRNGSTEHSLSIDDGVDSSYPDLAVSRERVAVTWFDGRDGNSEVYLFAGAIADFAAPIDAKAARVTRTAGSSIGAYVTWNDARIGLAWCDTSSGQYEVYGQIFDDQGSTLGAARRLTYTPTQSLVPAIRPWRNGFAVAWNEYQPAGPDNMSAHGSALSSTAMLELIQ